MSANSNSEKDVSLPANRAFVIQLQASSGASEVGHRGRVEHVASGRALHFAAEHELWAFVDSVLATECSEQMDAAYSDLIAAHASRDTVAAIAERNGCSHLGRFSCEFRERFGQLPTETLRSWAEIDVEHASQALHPVFDAHRTHEQRPAAYSTAVRAAKR